VLRGRAEEGRVYLLDQEEVLRRVLIHVRFWGEKRQGEGAYIAISSPDDEAAAALAELSEPENIEDRWFDVDYRVRKTMLSVETSYYAGDSVPVAYAHFGPANLSGLIGAGRILADDTIFFGLDPLIEDWGNLPELRIDKEGKLYKAIRYTARELARLANGRFVVAISDIGSNLDTLACLRTRENALIDMISEPGRVKDMFETIFELWREFYEENRGWATEYSPYMSAPSPFVFNGKWCKVESESSVMISLEMFEEFMLPALQRQVDYLDRSMFNLDGYDHIRILPGALKLKGLHSVAWSPNAKADSFTGAPVKDFITEESINVCKTVQAAGKKLALQNISPYQVEAMFDHISPDGVFMTVRCRDRKEADEFASYSAKWRNLSDSV